MDQVYSFICSLSDASRKRSRSPTESGSNTATSSTPCAHPYLRLQVLETATLFDVAMLLFEHHPALQRASTFVREQHQLTGTHSMTHSWGFSTAQPSDKNAKPTVIDTTVWTGARLPSSRPSSPSSSSSPSAQVPDRVSAALAAAHAAADRAAAARLDAARGRSPLVSDCV